MSVARRLREAIEHKGVSIREFQREMEHLTKGTGAKGSSYPAIHRALQGKTVPSVPFLELAADYLGVRRAWLMAGDGPMVEKDFGSARFPLPLEQNDAWRELVVALLAGNRVSRPAPEYREAIKLQIRAWHLFLTQWRKEVGDVPDSDGAQV